MDTSSTMRTESARRRAQLSFFHMRSKSSICREGSDAHMSLGGQEARQGLRRSVLLPRTAAPLLAPLSRSSSTSTKLSMVPGCPKPRGAKALGSRSRQADKHAAEVIHLAPNHIRATPVVQHHGTCSRAQAARAAASAGAARRAGGAAFPGRAHGGGYAAAHGAVERGAADVRRCGAPRARRGERCIRPRAHPLPFFPAPSRQVSPLEQAFRKRRICSEGQRPMPPQLCNSQSVSHQGMC